MTTKTRLCALALAGLSASAALPATVAARSRPPAGPPPVVEVRQTLGELGVPVPSPRALVRRVDELARRAAALERAAERARTPRFPVAGPFNWGQEGARYGSARSGHVHEGQDVFAVTGTPLIAVSDGVVVETGDDGGRGNYVAIFDPAAGRTYVYLHMVGPAEVGQGTRVNAGERVGAVGCTGSCFGDHLHFEIRRGRGPEAPSLDPLPALSRWAEVHHASATLAPGAS